MLLNYDKFVEGITEIGLVEDDLQVQAMLSDSHREAHICLVLHLFTAKLCIVTLLYNHRQHTLEQKQHVNCLLWLRLMYKSTSRSPNRPSASMPM